LLAYNAGHDGSSLIYEHTFIGGNAKNLTTGLYTGTEASKYFTSNPNKLIEALDAVVTQGDENTLLALDCAADFPFDSQDETRRVIALFTDEKLEDGILREEPLGRLNEILKKIKTRGISLYAYLPESDSAANLRRLPKSIITGITPSENTWDNLDFKALLEQMGKSISVSSAQKSKDAPYQKAIYGQDTWSEDCFVDSSDSRRQKIKLTGDFYGQDVSFDTNSIFIIDLSTSMQREGRLKKLKQTLFDIIDQASKLKTGKGKFRIIAFSTVMSHFPNSGLAAYSSEEDLEACHNYVYALKAKGQTDMVSGWNSACSLISRYDINTVYFLTDGRGNIKNFDEFKSRYGHRLPKETTIHSFAIGLTSEFLKDIADNYNGNYHEL
jgi:Mg-chelatase subunit ChlD